ncbi:RING finger domain-containing protein [Pyrenophora tritici-repentis]|nr:RING finger domain-containing protein [Pyrenophora tritici-repentis]
MLKSCMLCGSEESEVDLLLSVPCGRHWICSDDVASFFEHATNNESLFPPKCCGQILLLEDYEDHVPFDVAWAYQKKEQGEYAILAKFRVYCGHPPCATFLHPTSHLQDPETKTAYAICEAEGCGKLTCTKCRALIQDGIENHECQKDEEAKRFKQAAAENGYQECTGCGATVELSEACKHITCGCGQSFCYVCGRDWEDYHACPIYGPPIFDEEGYNQDGFHRDTGLNRAGLNRRQDITRARAEHWGDGGDDETNDEQAEWEVLQHLNEETRHMLELLPPHVREEVLDQFRIELFETQGILFDQFQGENDEDAEVEDDEAEHENDEDSEGGESDIGCSLGEENWVMKNTTEFYKKWLHMYPVFVI